MNHDVRSSHGGGATGMANAVAAGAAGAAGAIGAAAAAGSAIAAGAPATPGAASVPVAASASAGIGHAGSGGNRGGMRVFGRQEAAQRAVRVIDGRAEDRHVWAIAALVFPLVFCAIVGVGVYLMFHRDMGYFKPAPSGSAAPLRNGERHPGPGNLA